MDNVTPIRPEPKTREPIAWSPSTQAFLDEYGPKHDDQ